MFKVTNELEIKIPMRDGANISANVWYHDKPAMTVLVRTFYGKNDNIICNDPIFPNQNYMMENGYNYVICDCRGTFDSDGTVTSFTHEKDDGYDVCEWIANQPWSNGDVVLAGGSYVGYTVWSAIASGHKSIKAALAAMPLKQIYGSPWYSVGGGLMFDINILWASEEAMAEISRAYKRANTPEKIKELNEDYLAVSRLALDKDAIQAKSPRSATILKKYFPDYMDWIEHPDYDEYWKKIQIQEEDICVPTYQIGGWYDLLTQQMLRSYIRTKENGRNDKVKSAKGQILLIGPWNHAETRYTGAYSTMYYGPNARLSTPILISPPKLEAGVPELTSAFTKFVNYWVGGDEHALDDAAPVHIFVMGTNVWRDEQSWPLPDTKWTDFYLGSNDSANTSGGTGTLSIKADSITKEDTFLSNPNDPVPTMGGTIIAPPTSLNGPQDRQNLEKRNDVLCYSTPILDKDVEVTGPIMLNLNVSSNALDTDFHATLVDVFPDGRALHITDGMLRMRYRESLEKQKLMNPGEVYKITVDMGATSNTFLAGHRIRLEITGSNFPQIDKNTNTGNCILDDWDNGNIFIAANTVYHDAIRPSRLIMPIIDR